MNTLSKIIAILAALTLIISSMPLIALGNDDTNPPVNNEQEIVGQGTDGQGTDGQGTDGQGTDGQGTDGQGTDGQGTDGQGTDGQGTDGQGTDGQGTDGQGTDGQGTEGTDDPEEDDGVKKLTLDVKNGDDIGAAFTALARQARDNADGTIYEITVPAGTYTSTKQLVLWSNTYVYLKGVTIKHVSSESNMMRFGYKGDLDAQPATGYNAFTNIHIIGGTLDGGGLKKAILQIGHANNISFEGVTFQNVYNAHMLEAGGCSDVTISNCTFKDFKGSWDASTNYEAVQFEIVTTINNHFNGYASNDDETPCRRITVKNCTFRNLQRGIGTHTGLVNSYFDNMVFENNKFENITGFAVIATNYRNSKINNNTINNCGSGIIFRTVELAHKNFYPSTKTSNKHDKYTSANSQILNNRINVSTGYAANYNNVAYGIQLAGEKLTAKAGTVPAGDFRCAGVTVQGNAINLNCTGYGIWLYGAVANRIARNSITCNLAKKGKGGTGDGIRLQLSTNNNIDSNSINNTTKSGYDTDLSGITLRDYSSSNVINANKINKAKKDGIHIEKSNSNRLTSNAISTPGRDGIHIESASSVNAASNAISSSKRYGVLLKSVKSSVFNKNNVKSCKSDGFHLEKSTSNKLTSNSVSSAGRDGIQLAQSSDSCTVSSNSVASSKRHGVSLFSKTKKLTVTKNTIKKSKNCGIYAQSKKQIKKDSGNKISKSGKRARSYK